ncbi:hypothetical protein AGR3A_Cc280003 [Agrobacterium tomkonis CFBP 6623]|uniref:Uncharacterized protein n=1 Tax=Agrobacterium tomkonis CFBP 6623 TaxID=1183432 RepID=A0A1S7PNE9_9HYPH|nr:hypothetical protein AGR3A_Cc280003 [Agrobacterium tomkonis CFBP 6623]
MGQRRPNFAFGFGAIIFIRISEWYMKRKKTSRRRVDMHIQPHHAAISPSACARRAPSS